MGTACPQAGLRALRSAVCWGSAAVHQPQTDARHSSASAAAAFEFVPHGPAHSATFCTATVTLYGSKGPFVFIISTKHGLHSPVSAAAGFKSVPHSPAHCKYLVQPLHGSNSKGPFLSWTAFTCICSCWVRIHALQSCPKCNNLYRSNGPLFIISTKHVISTKEQQV